MRAKNEENIFGGDIKMGLRGLSGTSAVSSWWALCPPFGAAL